MVVEQNTLFAHDLVPTFALLHSGAPLRGGPRPHGDLRTRRTKPAIMLRLVAPDHAVNRVAHILKRELRKDVNVGGRSKFGVIVADR